MSAAESRLWLRDYHQIPAHLADPPGDVMLPPDELYPLRGQTWVRNSVLMRIQFLDTQLPVFHPAYRNAALSLGRIWAAVRDGREKDYKAACEAFIQDMLVGRDLEETTNALLDAATNRNAAPPPPDAQPSP